MGAIAPYLHNVREQAAKLLFHSTVSVNVMDMAKRMFLADLSLDASGGTAWERGCLGLPSVLVVLAENQAAVAKALDARGAAIEIGNLSEIGEALPEVLSTISNSARLACMSKAAAQITDGLGTCRVANLMNELKW